MPLHAGPLEQRTWPATPSVAAYAPRDVAAISAQTPMPQVREREPLRAQTEPPATFPVTTVTPPGYTVSMTAAHMGVYDVITPGANPGSGPVLASGPAPMGAYQVYTSGYRYPDGQGQGRSATGATASPLGPGNDVAAQPRQGYVPGVNSTGYPYGDERRSAQSVGTTGDGTNSRPDAQSRWGTATTTGLAPPRPSEHVEVQQPQRHATEVYPVPPGFEDGGRRPFPNRGTDGRAQLRPGRRAPDPSDLCDDAPLIERDEAPTASSQAEATARSLIGSFRPFIDFAAFPTFDGTDNLQERKVWFEKFKITAESAGWTGPVRCQRLKLSLAKKALSWVKQLSRDDHGNWRVLERKFVDKFCRSRDSGMEYYHSLSQGQGEDAVAYLWRLNGAAIRAGISIDSQKALAAHVTRFIRTLSDDRARRTLEGRSFRDVQDLEETLERLGDHSRAPRVLELHQSNRSFRSRDVRHPRIPDRKASSSPRAYRADAELGYDDVSVADEEDEGDRQDLAEAQEDDRDLAYESSVYRVAAERGSRSARARPTRDSKDGRAHADPRQDAKTQREDGHAFQAPVSPRPGAKCYDCGEEGHYARDCPAGIKCKHCGDKHASDRCWRRCPACTKVHELGKCEIAQVWRDLCEWNRTDGAADHLPPSLYRSFQEQTSLNE
ncbi:hypothetical protein BBJ28_00024993 [Nothophytophthora sp. Chile5]|nr:hypothetical protein BBJ28_00024993 [Nothophytophthora sp. Chile5]